MNSFVVECVVSLVLQFAKTNDSKIELPLSQEEKWQKGIQKKKAKYYNPPTNMTGMESIYTSPPWCGKGQIAKRTIELANTCTVDNLLYFIVLSMKTRPSLLSEIESKQTHDKCFKLLLKVYLHFML